MDFEMLFAFLFVIVLFSILMGTIGGIWKRKIRLKERELEYLHQAKGSSGEASITPERARQIEERLRNLERIVTEGNYGLAREIEDLRQLEQPVQLDKEVAR